MSTPSIASQPVYAPPAWDASGRCHVVLADGRDAAAAQALCAAAPAGPLAVVELCEGAGSWRPLLPPGARHTAAGTLATALAALEAELARARMGTRLYLLGSEDLIWQAWQVATRHGLGDAEVRRHCVLTAARPVYCVHCGHVLRGVHTNPVACTGCGRHLFVRDHFSRRLGAYMGVQIDAEAPGSLPEPVQAYP
ncbi:dimethylamine monooxygenase subunit DmmA family protein [Azohydromonas aeria]|uniref:dimethylamine monooxygenase subunit DmmA family protein n=1 Tax=Azohydromonas aeria TaxID=2590212 RepID=UPI0012F8D112|nr:dimethylamine monooxygenase subunit DmmA family protein [Azohydromonas aeria]